MKIGTADFTPREGRDAPKRGDRVRVYRNLPLFKHRVFSILAMDGPNKGLVLGYSRAVCLERVTFKVSQATREKVVQSQTRTVHAYAEGYFVSATSALPSECARLDVAKVTYNPFSQPHFYDRRTPEKAVWSAQRIWTWGADLIAPAPGTALAD